MKSIGKSLFILFLVAGVLLLLDLGNREKVKKDALKIAVFKMTTRPSLDDTEDGVMEALTERGFLDSQGCTIQHFSADNDMVTANAIAQNIVSSRFDMVVTISTPAMQVMANANKKGDVMHVFCTVTDPYVSGVGITGTEPDQHPPHLVGIGTFQPVEETFALMKQIKPDLKKVGTVWCTSETCSEACVRLARKKCAELGIELLEMSVENTTQILEAAMSLTARGVEALWVGGDNVVEAAIDQMINAAAKAKIPLIINNTNNVYGNTLFGLGAEYTEVGYLAGQMAADVLEGKPTSEIGVRNMVPLHLLVNPDALNNIRDKWALPEQMQPPAQLTIH
ncbi:MAG: ABC transporter substrate-binding protein [Bacteroidales bacterium]|jgi:putative ABC transport system substrate-binding protein|nr:ABC transporter substrate-binding protein [Bacteroidales bacterium]